jgi:hypothetical protein
LAKGLEELGLTLQFAQLESSSSLPQVAVDRSKPAIHADRCNPPLSKLNYAILIALLTLTA